MQAAHATYIAASFRRPVEDAENDSKSSLLFFLRRGTERSVHASGSADFDKNREFQQNRP